MRLSNLLEHLINLPPNLDRHINGLAIDSREVRPGEVFIALVGNQTTGEIYIESALQQGAIAILKEAPSIRLEQLANDIPCISLPQLSQRVGEMAAQFYHYPSRDLRIIGVTGTNGKTSVTHMLAQILSAYMPCGLIGTLGYGTYGALQPNLHTTPDAVRLQTWLAQFRDQNVQAVAMEVSSHALIQGRVNGVIFETAVLTNLSRDHLDYHHTMMAYGEAKQRLFNWVNLKTAVINYDEPFGQQILANLPHNITSLTYSIEHPAADIYAYIRSNDVSGCHLEIYSQWGNGTLVSPLLGKFNVSNLLATLTVLLNMGLSLPQLLAQLATIRAVPGRMERFGQAHHPTVIVDYAHTPDALEKVLITLREQNQLSAAVSVNNRGKLWCVFGCGGNRDRGKRLVMGEIAQRYADKVIITDDNPRHESSLAIINDILQGCPQPEAVIPDRQQAIRYVLQQAKVGDVVLIAGKGHENYQQIGEERLPFSDRTLVTALLI